MDITQSLLEILFLNLRSYLKNAKWTVSGTMETAGALSSLENTSDCACWLSMLVFTFYLETHEQEQKKALETNSSGNTLFKYQCRANTFCVNSRPWPKMCFYRIRLTLLHFFFIVTESRERVKSLMHVTEVNSLNIRKCGFWQFITKIKWFIWWGLFCYFDILYVGFKSKTFVCFWSGFL